VYKAGGRRKFERLVREALEHLPPELAEKMSNVDIVVEAGPAPGDLNSADDRELLLGLYHGIPLTDRGEGYFGVLPDRITLYQRNIESLAMSARDLITIVRRTVIHEIAHHFGIDDDRLEELGWA
jgi:predicted Zn-dependent protease with MMP-like domain